MENQKRLMDAEELVKFLRGKWVAKYPFTYYFGLLAAADEIERLPAVDAVEVVRCKDCKHGKLEDVMYYRTVDGETNDTTLYRCYYRWNYSELNKGEHFCSYGERRTDV